MANNKVEGFKFLNGSEGLEFFENQSSLDIKKYTHREGIKLWPGQSLAVYTYESLGAAPTIIAKLKVVELSMTSEDGTRAKLINLTNGETYNVGHIPGALARREVGMYIPQRPTVERTVKVVGDRHYYGMCMTATLMFTAQPVWNEVGHVFVCDWKKLVQLCRSRVHYLKMIDEFSEMVAANINQEG